MELRILFSTNFCHPHPSPTHRIPQTTAHQASGSMPTPLQTVHGALCHGRAPSSDPATRRQHLRPHSQPSQLVSATSFFGLRMALSPVPHRERVERERERRASPNGPVDIPWIRRSGETRSTNGLEPKSKPIKA